jgi:hypothetical protein
MYAPCAYANLLKSLQKFKYEYTENDQQIIHKVTYVNILIIFTWFNIKKIKEAEKGSTSAPNPKRAPSENRVLAL